MFRIAAVLLLLVPAFAQVDLSGVWAPVFHEDQPERIPGPALADYLGLPINDFARQWALAWDPDRLTAPRSTNARCTPPPTSCADPSYCESGTSATPEPRS